MKTKLLSLFVIMIVFSSMILAKSKYHLNKHKIYSFLILDSKKHKKSKIRKNTNQRKYNIFLFKIFFIFLADPKKYKNIHDILRNYPAAKDNRDLWKNMDDGNYKPVAFNGVHNPHDYKPPVAGHSTGGFKISSPSPKRKPLKGDRVIAGDLAGPSNEKSVFDLPDRKNVLQINMPDSTSKKISYHYNSNLNVQEPNMKLEFHGTETVKKPTYHGKFIEMESDVKPMDKKAIKKAIAKKKAQKAAKKKAKKAAKKKLAKRVENVNEKSFKKAKDDALQIAKKVEKIAGDLSKKVHVTPNKLMIPIHYNNKREHNNIQQKMNKV